MDDEELIKTYFANRHILQSPEWGQFKSLMGTRAVTAGKTQLTIHKLPFGLGTIGYAPKIRPEDLDEEKLYSVGRRENCLFIKLDVPHADNSFRLLASGDRLVPGKSVFANSTILMDLTKSDEELLAAMHEKTRYNLNLARRKGVTVRVYPDDPQGHALNISRRGLEKALDEFIRLQKETAYRQKFFIHPDHYYRTGFEVLSAHGMAYLLEAQITSNNSQLTTNNRAASWMLFRYEDILYYPYGESDYELRSYMPSNLLMWEAIQLGKNLGCKVFDLWGAADDPDDEKDPWHGFTRFKLSFGGTHVKLAPTYDLIINETAYRLFEKANDLRWKILRLAKR